MLISSLCSNAYLVVQPQRNPVHDLQQDAAYAPHVNRRNVGVVLGEGEQFVVVGVSFLFVEEVDELGGYVLGGSEPVLVQVLEEEAGTIVD